MKTEPVFCGKIHITEIKNGKRFLYDFKTSAKNDKKILEFAQTVCPDTFSLSRQNIALKSGEDFREIIEKSIGKKINIPNDASYSVLHSENYNSVKKKKTHSILLFCEEILAGRRNLGDCTAIDIYI